MKTFKRLNVHLSFLYLESVFRELVKKMEDIAFELKDKGVEAARKKMQQALEKWKNEEIKVAFVGNSGVGKSSLINALRK